MDISNSSAIKGEQLVYRGIFVSENCFLIRYNRFIDRNRY